MEYIALALSILALFVACRAARKTGASPEALEDSKNESRRRVENLGEELKRELGTQRRLLAEMASGAHLERDQIMEGRLWRDVQGDEAKTLMGGGRCRVLDVRTPQETSRGVLPGAQLIPVAELEERLAEVQKDDRPLLVYCAGGGRSAAACEFLSSAGYGGLHNLAGGIGAWNGPLEKPAHN